MRQTTMEMVDREKIIAIVRGAGAGQCMKIADALYEGGIRLMEITFAQKHPDSFAETAEAIRAISEKYKGRMLVGAGTVTTPTLVELAANAGAKYIISPDCNAAVICRTRELGLVSMPGAMTPTEVMQAHWAGADYVKLFPAGNLGVGYVKAIRAPISHVKLLAVGGINEHNVADFLKAGMVGAGIGGNLANKAWIEAGEYHKITETARKLVEAIKGA